VVWDLFLALILQQTSMAIAEPADKKRAVIAFLLPAATSRLAASGMCFQTAEWLARNATSFSTALTCVAIDVISVLPKIFCTTLAAQIPFLCSMNASVGVD
jgi:hypothetical protein